MRFLRGSSTEFDVLGTLARFSLLLLLVTTLPAALAFANPPDPTWLHGIYDEGDLDNVVDLISSSVGAVNSIPPDDRCFAPLVVAVLPEMYERALSSERPALIHSRAPPAL